MPNRNGAPSVDKTSIESRLELVPWRRRLADRRSDFPFLGVEQQSEVLAGDDILLFERHHGMTFAGAINIHGVRRTVDVLDIRWGFDHDSHREF